MWRIRSAVDPAVGVGDRSDYFAMATVGLDDTTGLIHILDVFRDRLDLTQQPRFLEQHYSKWRLRGLPYVLIEKSYSQTALIQYIVRRGLCPVKPIDLRAWSRLHGGQSATKEIRAGSLAARYEQGQIVHPTTAPWLDVYEQELLEFPRGEHDDMVDAVTYAVDDISVAPTVATHVLYHDFTVDGDMRPEDVSGLYEELGVPA